MNLPDGRQGLKEHKGTQKENFVFLSIRVSPKFFGIFWQQEFIVVKEKSSSINYLKNI